MQNGRRVLHLVEETPLASQSFYSRKLPEPLDDRPDPDLIDEMESWMEEMAFLDQWEN